MSKGFVFVCVELVPHEYLVFDVFPVVVAANYKTVGEFPRHRYCRIVAVELW